MVKCIVSTVVSIILWQTLLYLKYQSVISVATNILWLKPRPHKFSLFSTYKNLQVYASSIFVGSENHDELASAVMQRTGPVNDGERPTLLVCFNLVQFYLHFLLALLCV